MQLHRIGKGIDCPKDHAGENLHFAGLIAAEIINLRITRIARKHKEHSDRQHPEHSPRKPRGRLVKAPAQRIAHYILFHERISFLT